MQEIFSTFKDPPRNSCFLLYAVKQVLTFSSVIFFEKKFELSLEATPIKEFFIITLFELNFDCSPTEMALSPQSVKSE